MRRQARKGDNFSWLRHRDCGGKLAMSYGPTARHLAAACGKCLRRWTAERFVAMTDEEMALHFDSDVDPAFMPVVRLVDVVDGKLRYTKTAADP